MGCEDGGGEGEGYGEGRDGEGMKRDCRHVGMWKRKRKRKCWAEF
jgi:hypothetical protein